MKHCRGQLPLSGKYDISRKLYQGYRYGFRDGEVFKQQYSDAGRSVNAGSGKSEQPGRTFTPRLSVKGIQQLLDKNYQKGAVHPLPL